MNAMQWKLCLGSVGPEVSWTIEMIPLFAVGCSGRDPMFRQECYHSSGVLGRERCFREAYLVSQHRADHTAVGTQVETATEPKEKGISG